MLLRIIAQLSHCRVWLSDGWSDAILVRSQAAKQSALSFYTCHQSVQASLAHLNTQRARSLLSSAMSWNLFGSSNSITISPRYNRGETNLFALHGKTAGSLLLIGQCHGTLSRVPCASARIVPLGVDPCEENATIANP